MEKIKFMIENTGDAEEFFVLEQTKMRGETYILVTDSDADDAQCLILKDISSSQSQENLYEIVEDETELLAVAKVFEELLEDIDIEI
ncbi:MAG: DUF1292 domain-containing protein [Hespellia sp.]|jgi:hypothetical protein|nr:DUF1292 domain-containing protein [Hespellia sp.]